MAFRVLLVNPNRMKPAVAPLALDYLCAALEQRGIQAFVLDLCFEDDPAQAAADSATRFDAGLVGLTIRNTDDCYFLSRDFSLERIHPVVQALKATLRAPIVVGGTGFSLAAEAILNFLQLDLGVVGDGEDAICSLAERLRDGRDYSDIPGLICRTPTGFIRNAPRHVDLASVPFHRRSAIDNRRYFREGGMAGLETKRGCGRRCIYCADPVAKGRTSRLRPPASVADEFQALLDMGIDHVHLCDSEFNLPLEHAREVCDELVRRRLGDRVRWYTYASPAPFDRELAALMKQAGCVGINFGVDSGDDGMLKNLGREFTSDDIRQTARICHEEGIVFMYDLLLGGPGETKETARRTIELMKQVSPHRVGTSAGLRIYAGTAMAALVRREGFTVQNRNLHGAIEGNQHFLRPVFYMSAALGDDPFGYLRELIGDDTRFFLAATDAEDRNYNYNENTALVEAIRQGYRGAFWDILRRLQS